MKSIKTILLIVTAAMFSIVLAGFFANAVGAPGMALPIAGALFAASFIPKGEYSLLDTVTPDLSKLSTSFVQWGGKILRKHVNGLNLKSGVTPYKNVKVPQAMTKLSALGGPRPYRDQDDTDGNGAEFTDRTLNVYQSKWDFDVDPEKYRGKYLATDTKAPFYEYILDQVGIEYMSAINNKTIGKGARNAAGTGAADIADGWITILAREAAKAQPEIVAKAIGAINGTNAVTKVETFASAQPEWWREQGFVIKCSYATFDAYKTHYRASFGYTFQPREDGKHYLDGFSNVYLEPVSWITNDGLLGVVYDALAFGTDGERIQVAASVRRNIIEVRLMMPVGLEFEDLECISISDNLIAA
jgi:hypothetical protein